MQTVRHILRGTSMAVIAGLASYGAAASLARAADDAGDPYIWLEDPASPAAQAWVAKHNTSTLPQLTDDPRYSAVKSEILAQLEAPDKLPDVTLQSDFVYNFWQDAKHAHGIWRRQPLRVFGQPGAAWDTVLDLDAVAAADKIDWVWEAADCLAPAYTRCLVQLSNGGQDAVVLRELDLTTKAFVPAAAGGFALPQAKISVAWLDSDTLLLGTDWGPDSQTTSGYPREIRLWHRGTAWQDAVQVLAADRTDLDAFGKTYADQTGSIHLLVRDLDFFRAKRFILEADGTQKAVGVPDDADIDGYFRGALLLRLGSPWTSDGKAFPAGSVVAFDLVTGAAEALYQPDGRASVSSVSVTHNRVVVTALENVTSTLYAFTLENGAWSRTRLTLPARGTAQVTGSDAFAEALIVRFESFLSPPSLLGFQPGQDGEPKTLAQTPPRFPVEGLVVEQRQAVSRDGTGVPYFIVHQKAMQTTGDNPTLLYGYGGFAVSETPRYSAPTGKEWLAKGGVYVVANIRGGGEFGPAWHDAALTRHRQASFDDFIAVAEDLIRQGVTSPRHLGIKGSSNGGLLVGTVAVERPDLFGAVVCDVPLLDMLRYTDIAAGASWTSEYGDPSDPVMRATLRQYSPYQNLQSGRTYPKIFLMTAQDDDRVGPGHARKMAARMEEQGKPFLFYETTEGGHGNAPSLEAQATEQALQLTYLYQQLFDGR